MRVFTYACIHTHIHSSNEDRGLFTTTWHCSCILIWISAFTYDSYSHNISSRYLTYLYCNFRVKHFLAQRAAIKMMSVDIHQMFLQLIRFGEEFETTLTTIFCGSGHEMCGNMLFKGLVIICTRELSTTVWACKSTSGGWTLGTVYSAVLVWQHA